MEEVVAGLDIGTSSIKLVLYGDNGVIYSDKEDFSREVSCEGIIEPRALLDKTMEILFRAVKKNESIKIKAVAMSSIFPSLVILDSQGNPITAILTWADNRASSLVEEFKKNLVATNEIHKKTGCIVHESYSPWRVLWFKEHEKEIFSKAYKFVSLSEYLTYKFTGKFVVSKSIASTSGFFNISGQEWDKQILDLAGIDASKLSECRDIYHSEKMTSEFCSKTGLAQDTVLVLGAGDGLLCHIISGCGKKSIMSSTLGTSGALRLLSDTPLVSNPSIWCYYLDENRYVLGSAINAGGSSLNWFTEKIIKDENKDFYKELDCVLTKLEIKGPIFLPFLDGERGPNYNQDIKASFVGLSSKDSLHSLYRSMVEGIFFNMYSCYEKIIKEASRPSEIRASGGYTNSDLMLQMQSDIFNEKFFVPDVKQASAMGAAIIALKSIGKISDISEFEVKVKKTFYPNSKRHEKYMERYKIYKELYKSLSSITPNGKTI
jgi:gluconokinase